MSPKLSNAPALRPYQRQAIEWMARNDRTLLASDMGTGKSAQALLSTYGRTLVIAPAMAVHGNVWRDEVARWAPERTGDITIVPFTSLLQRAGRKVLLQLKPEYAGPWDSIVIDECHALKSRKVTWLKPIQQLCREAELVRMLSGTPVKAFAPDVFNLLQILRPHDARGGGELGSYWRWADKWFDVMDTEIRTRQRVIQTKDINGLRGCECELGRDDTCEHYEVFFRENFGELLKRHLRDDVLPDLPALTTQVIECPMTTAQARAYRGLKKDFVAEMPDGALKVAWNSGAKNTIIDRCATGLGVMDDGISVPLDGESGKLDILRELLCNRSRPTLVFAHFRQSVEAAAIVARSMGKEAAVIHGGTSPKDRGAIVEAFQAGQVDVLVGSLATMAESLTLTTADCVIMLETSWEPSRNEQAVRRIHRLGQENPCTVYDLITPDSIDQHKRELLKAKTDAQAALLTYSQFAALL